MGGYTDIIALKANSSYCCFLSQQRKEDGGQGEAHIKSLVTTLFNARQTPFSIDKVLEKAHFYSFAEKCRGPDPHDLSHSNVPVTR